MGTELYKKGLNVKDFIKVLEKLPQDKVVWISCDEEQNTLFKGFYVEDTDGDVIIIAGLSGTEEEE